MSDTDNNLIRQFVRDVFINHGIEPLDELLAPDFVYSSDFIKEPKDSAWVKGMLEQVFTAMPNFSVAVESFNAKGNIITLMLVFSATLKHEFMGIAAKGQRFEGPGMVIFEVKDDHIVRIQAKLETADFLQQLQQAT